MKIYFDSEVEQLDNELNTLISSSQDPKFTAFLYQLKGELAYAPEHVQDLRGRAIANYDMYVSRMRSAGAYIEPLYFKAIYNGAEVEVIYKKPETSKAEESKSEVSKPEAPKTEEPKAEESKAAESKAEEPKAEEPKASVPEKEAAETEAHKAEAPNAETPKAEAPKTDAVKPVTTASQSVYNTQNAVNSQPVNTQAQSSYIRSYYQGNPAGSVQTANSYIQPTQDPVDFLKNVQPVVDPKNVQPAPSPAPVYQAPTFNPQSISKKTEYAIGAIVMSVLGAVFLLTGLVYFAVNFLDTFTQGMLMYAACIIVLAVSELFVRRFVFKLSAVFTAIGISGLFLTTVVNYRALDNISLPVAGVILGICAILVCLFGFYRKSRLYSAIGFFAGFASSVAIGSDVTPVEYMVITLGTLLISCLWMIFPVEKQHKIVDTLMILAEITYLFIGLGFRVNSDSSMTVSLVKLTFGLVSWFVCQFVYFHSESTDENPEQISDLGIVNLVFMIIAAVIYSIMIAASNNSNLDEIQKITLGVIAYLGMTIPSLAFAFLLNKKKAPAWKVFYILFTVSGMLVVFFTESPFVVPLVFAFHILTNKIILRNYPDNTSIRVIDVLIEIFVACILTFSAQLFAPDAGQSMIYLYFPVIVLCAAMVAGMFITSGTMISAGFVVVTQIATIISVTSAVCTVFIPSKLALVCAMGIVLLFTFLINSLSSLRTDENGLINYAALVTEILLLHILAAKYYAGDGFLGIYVFDGEKMLIFAIAAIFDLTFLLLTLRKEYGIFYAEQYILIPIYMTWVTLLAPISKNFLLSIILMAIAVISVIIGFALKRKGIRVYGLVLSILVCAKIAFIDFVTLDDVKSKTIMYILVGAFALLIGTIYMVLESRENKALAKKNEQGAS